MRCRKKPVPDSVRDRGNRTPRRGATSAIAVVYAARVACQPPWRATRHGSHCGGQSIPLARNLVAGGSTHTTVWAGSGKGEGGRSVVWQAVPMPADARAAGRAQLARFQEWHRKSNGSIGLCINGDERVARLQRDTGQLQSRVTLVCNSFLQPLRARADGLAQEHAILGNRTDPSAAECGESRCRVMAKTRTVAAEGGSDPIESWTLRRAPCHYPLNHAIVSKWGIPVKCVKR